MNSADTNTSISEEIPDEVEKPEPYDVVKSCMVHVP